MPSRFKNLYDDVAVLDETVTPERDLERPLPTAQPASRFKRLFDEPERDKARIRFKDLPDVPPVRERGLRDLVGVAGRRAISTLPPVQALKTARFAAREPVKKLKALGTGVLTPLAGITQAPELIEKARITTIARLLGKLGIEEEVEVDGKKIPISPETLTSAIFRSIWNPISRSLGKKATSLSQLKTFDKSIIELVKEKDFEKAGDKLIFGILENAPQLAVQFAAAASGVGSIALAGLGVSAAGNKFAEIKDNPDMTLAQKTDNALLTGAAESLTEMATMGWMGRLISRAGGKEAAKSVIRSMFRKLAPPVTEGVEEIVAQIAENITDAATNKRNAKGELPGPFDNIGDPGIIGFVLGGAGTVADIGLDMAEGRQVAEPPPRPEEPAPEIRPVIDVVTGEEQPTPPGLVAREVVSEAPEEVLEPVEPEPPVEAVEEPVAAPEEAVELQEEEVRRAVEEREVEEGRVPERERVGEVRETAEAGRRDIVAEGREIEEAAPTEEVEEVDLSARVGKLTQMIREATLAGRRDRVEELIQMVRETAKEPVVAPKPKTKPKRKPRAKKKPKAVPVAKEPEPIPAEPVKEVAPAPTERNVVQEFVAEEGIKPKDQKQFLQSSVETAIKKAPLEKDLPEKHQKTFKEIGKIGRGPGSFQEKQVLERTLPHVSVQMPDGARFTLINTKEALRDFHEGTKKFPVGKLPSGLPSQPRVTEKKSPKLDKPTTSNKIKMLSRLAGQRPDQPSLENIFSDGENLVATDGAQMLIIPHKGLGTTESSVSLQPSKTGIQNKVEGVGGFPRYREVIPKKTQSIAKDVNTDTLFRDIATIRRMTSETFNAVKIYRNPDGTLGMAVVTPEVGEQSVNLQSGAQFISAMDSDFLHESMRIARILGNETVDISFAQPEKGETSAGAPVLIEGKNFKHVIMPIKEGTGTKLGEQSLIEGVTAEPIQFSGIPPEKVTGNAVENVETAIATLKKRWKNGPVNIVVLETAADAPQRIKDAAPAVGFRGAYDPLPDPQKPGEDTVYLVADRLPDAETAAFVAVHEVVGHRGIEAIIGNKQSNRFYSQLANGRARDIAKYAKEQGLNFQSETERRHAAKEWLADRVGSGELGNAQKWWQRLLDMVRKATAKITGQEFSEENLSALVRRAHRVTEGVQVDAVIGPPPLPVTREPSIPPPLPKKSAPPPIPKQREELKPTQTLFDKSYEDAMDFLNKGKWSSAILEAATKRDKNEKPDLGALDTTFLTIQWYNNKVQGLKKLWEAARRLTDMQHIYERLIWYIGPNGEGESQHALLQSYTRKFKTEWASLTDRNWDKDLNAEGYWVKKKGEKQFTVMSWRVPGEELFTVESSNQAWDAIYMLDRQDVIDEGFSEDAGDAQLAIRQINHRDFEQLEVEVEKARELYEAAGIRPPRVVMEGEEISIFEAMKRMGDRRGHYLPRMRRGRFIADATKEGEPPITRIFDSKTLRKAWTALKIKDGWSVDFRISSRPSDAVFAGADILSMNDIMATALKNMERGAEGEVIYSNYGYDAKEIKFVTQKGEEETHFVLVPIEGGPRVGDQQFNAAKNGIKALGGQFYGTEQDGLGEDENGKPIEVWRFVNPPKDFEAKLGQALQFGRVTESSLNVFGKALVDHISAVLNSRGSRSRKIGRTEARGEKVPRGFETDILKAITMSTKATAAGTAKRMMAHEMLNAIAGTDVSWDQFLEEKGHDIDSEEFKSLSPKAKNRLWDEYSAMVEDKRIDSATQPRAYKEALNYAENMIRNQEPAERVFGMIRGVTGMWMLSGLAPGAVNLTAQLLTMPPAMKIFAGISLRPDKIIKLIATANADYTNHYLWSKFPERAKALKIPKLTDKRKIKTYDDIMRRGWDSPLRNIEAMEVLQNNVSKVYSKSSEYMLLIFSLTEQLNRGASHGATYDGIFQQHKGKWTEEDHEAAMEMSHKVTDAAHATYGDVNIPAPLRGSSMLAMAGRSAYMFSTFSHNMLQLAYAVGVKKSTRNAQATAWFILAPAILGGTGASLVTIPLVLLAKAIFVPIPGPPPDDPEEQFLTAIGEMFGPVPERFARSGFVGIAGPNFEGVDLKGSLEIRTEMPTTVADLLGAPASMITKVRDAWKFTKQGDYEKAAEALAPRVLAGPIRAHREYTKGLTTRGNQPIRFGDEQITANWWATVLRTLQFNPQSVSEKREKKWSETKIRRIYGERKAEINARFRSFLAEDRWDREAWLEIKKDMDEFNLQVIRNRYWFIPQIESPAIRRVITTFDNPTKVEREREEAREKSLKQAEIPERFRELTVPRSRRRRRTRPTRPTRPTR